MAKFKINIDNFLGGLAPAYWESDFPIYGNKNMAGRMKNVNLIDPSFLTQGLGTTTIDDDSGDVSNLITAILDSAVTSTRTYAVGGNKFYYLSSTEVYTPHTIDHGTYTGEDAEDLIYFRGDVYYTYNHSGGGDIGKYDVSGDSHNDDWGSTIPTDAAELNDNPHPMCSSGSFFYLGDGNKVTSYDSDNDTLIPTALDLPANETIVSIALSGNILYIASNAPNLGTGKKNIGSIYKWDRNSSSWRDDSIIGIGEVSSLFVKNGMVWVFQKDSTSNVSILGYNKGKQIKDVAYFYGYLPGHSQVSEYKNFIVWTSEDPDNVDQYYVYAFGSADDNKLDYMNFQLMGGRYQKIGSLASPFGDLLVSSTDDTNYDLSKAANYTTDSNWKSMTFDTTGDERGKSLIRKLIINFDTLATGARVDMTINCNNGTSSTSKTISYDNDGAINQIIWQPRIESQNFRLEFDWSNGSTTNPVKIRNIKIRGEQQ